MSGCRTSLPGIGACGALDLDHVPPIAALQLQPEPGVVAVSCDFAALFLVTDVVMAHLIGARPLAGPLRAA